jgi:hypothetical protein
MDWALVGTGLTGAAALIAHTLSIVNLKKSQEPTQQINALVITTALLVSSAILFGWSFGEFWN